MDLKSIKNLEHRAIQTLDRFLSHYLSSSDVNKHKKVRLLSYWIIDFIRFLTKEHTITPNTTYRRYERGSVIQLHLGYRIGNEEGGLHYAIVLNKIDSVRSSILTVIPLTSIKSNKKPVNPVNVNLGFNITKEITKKMIVEREKLKEQQKFLQQLHNGNVTETDIRKLAILSEDLTTLNANLDKIMKMKFGSIALVNQITTISKLRIYDPCSIKDLLYGIKLDGNLMDALDEKIKELYIKKVD